jgi:multicomponent Na+:H+ antiporter subunit F
LLVTLALSITRAILGPAVFDRVLAGNTVGTVAMMLLAVIGFLTGRPEFLDLAITYGLLNVVGTIVVLKFFRQGDLGDPGESGAVDERLAIDALTGFASPVAGSFPSSGRSG